MGDSAASKVDEWFDWLKSEDDGLRHEATLRLGGLSSDDRVSPSALEARFISSDDDEVFWAVTAATALGVRAGELDQSLALLVREHPTFGIRQAATRALGKTAPSSSVALAAVEGALQDSNAFVRRQALETLIAFADHVGGDTVALIRSAGSDPDESVARWSEIALRNLRGRGALEDG